MIGSSAVPRRRRLLSAAVVAAAAASLLIANQQAYAAETVVDVTTYGADKTGATDSTQDVEDAIAYAKTLTGPVRLLFPQGTYNLYPDAADQRELYLSNTEGAGQTYRFKKYALLLEDVQDFTVDGGGSTLRTHGLMGIFAVIRSERVTIKNFTSDHAAPKVVDVKVSDVAAGQRTLSIPAGNPFSISGTTLSFMSDQSPVTGNRYWQYTTSQMWYSQIYDAVNQKTWRGSNPLFQNVSSLTDLGGGKIRVNYTTTTTTPTDKGLVYQMRETTRDNAAGVIWESTDTTVTGLTARYLHGFGILGQLSTNVTITGNTFKTDPASGRSTAAFADMIQMSGIKGTVTINDNMFDGAHDDPINIHGTYLEVTAVSGNTLSLKYMHNQTAGFPQYHVGDTVEIVNKSTMATISGGTATVTAVDGPTGVDSSKPLTTMKITLDKTVPSTVTASNYVVENTSYTPAVQIARNVFRNIPTRGILLTTRGASVIEDNIFDGMSMASIYISSDAASWYESGPVRNVTIRRNKFLRPASPVIFFDPTNATVNKATPVHSGITIEDNDFYLNSQRIVQTKSVSNLTFKNNRVLRDDRDTVLALGGLTSGCTAVGSKPKLSVTTSGTAYGTSLFSFSGSAVLKLENNSYDNGFNLRADTGNTTVASDVTVTGDPVLINTTNTKPLLGTTTYTSSNTAVATIAADGTLTAVAAGTTTITATVAATGRTMSTPPVNLVVGGAGCASASAIPKTGWTAVADSAETTGENGAAARAIDGDLSTIWHTAYNPSIAPMPHRLDITLPSRHVIEKLTYTPRQTGGTNGNIANYEVSVSGDGVTWGSPIASGTFSTGTAEKTVTFTPVVTRYVRLRATSAQNGTAYAAAAEVGLYGRPYTPAALPKAGWTATADSAETTSENGAAGNAVDGNTATIWHTAYSSGIAPMPHQIDVKMEATHIIDTLEYLPRQSGTNGTIAAYQVFVSTDGTNWGTAVASGTFASGQTVKTVTFNPVSARYVRLKATSAQNGVAFASAAEITLRGN